MIGWRKLAAWTFVYAFVVFATLRGMDISANAVDLLKWVSGFFFGANMLKPAAQGVGAIMSKKANGDD